jgi:hypothetical protein
MALGQRIKTWTLVVLLLLAVGRVCKVDQKRALPGAQLRENSTELADLKGRLATSENRLAKAAELAQPQPATSQQPVELESIVSNGDRELLLVYATSIYGAKLWWKKRQEPDKHIECPVGDHKLKVTISWNFARATHADGLIYHGLDLIGAHISPFGSAPHKPLSHTGAVSLRVPLLDLHHPRNNSKVLVWYSEEPPQSTLSAELNATAMRNFAVFMGFHPKQTLARDGTVCYNGWGLRKWPFSNWQHDSPVGTYWNTEPVPWSDKRTDFDSAWIQNNCGEFDGSSAECALRREPGSERGGGGRDALEVQVLAVV